MKTQEAQPSTQLATAAVSDKPEETPQETEAKAEEPVPSKDVVKDPSQETGAPVTSLPASAVVPSQVPDVVASLPHQEIKVETSEQGAHCMCC